MRMPSSVVAEDIRLGRTGGFDLSCLSNQDHYIKKRPPVNFEAKLAGRLDGAYHRGPGRGRLKAFACRCAVK